MTTSLFFVVVFFKGINSSPYLLYALDQKGTIIVVRKERVENLRIKIHLNIKELETNKQRIPVCYRMMLLSLIKQGIHQSDSALYETLYQEKQVAKKLTFSLFMNHLNYLKEVNRFEFDGAVLTISSSDVLFMSKLLNGLSYVKTYRYKNQYVLSIFKIELENLKTITGNKATFTTMSPILIEDKNAKPVLVTADNFVEELNTYTNIRFQSLYGRELKNPLVLAEHQFKKRVIKEVSHMDDERILTYTTQGGSFTLQGDSEDLRLIYLDGLGKRTGQGFGCLHL